MGNRAGSSPAADTKAQTPRITRCVGSCYWLTIRDLDRRQALTASSQRLAPRVSAGTDRAIDRSKIGR